MFTTVKGEQFPPEIIIIFNVLLFDFFVSLSLCQFSIPLKFFFTKHVLKTILQYNILNKSVSNLRSIVNFISLKQSSSRLTTTKSYIIFIGRNVLYQHRFFGLSSLHYTLLEDKQCNFLILMLTSGLYTMIL